MTPEELRNSLLKSKMIMKRTEELKPQELSNPTRTKIREEVYEDPQLFTVGDDGEDLEREIPIREYKSIRTQSEELPRQSNNFSKLPPGIRESFMSEPPKVVDQNSITTSGLYFDEEFINEMKGIDNPSPKKRIIKENQQIIKESQKKTNINVSEIEKLVERIVEQKLQEYYDKKLMKESIQIKVGDTVFSGELKPLPRRRK